MGETIGSLCKAVLMEIDLTISSYLADIDKARVEMQAEQDRRAQEDREVIEIIGNALTALANGDLTHRIEGGRIPERLDALKVHFNQTAETLEQSLGKIAVNATNIVSNADGIRQGLKACPAAASSRPRRRRKCRRRWVRSPNGSRERPRRR
jgi:methyl-accepting chemotaxis protein